MFCYTKNYEPQLIVMALFAKRARESLAGVHPQDYCCAWVHNPTTGNLGEYDLCGLLFLVDQRRLGG